MAVVADFQGDFQGVNAGVSPAFILPNQVAAAINTRFRGRKPNPRYGVSMQGLVFASGDPAYFANEVYQGYTYYNRVDGDYFVFVIGGRVYVLQATGQTWTVNDVTPDDGNARYAPICYLCQADKYVIIQDGEHVPIVVSGTTAFRVGGVNPIPIGGVMAFGNGRLWLAIGDQLLAGDLVGSEADAVQKFSEATYLAEGGAFKLPGIIVGLRFIPSQDTATGTGTLLVHCLGYGIVSLNTIEPRPNWKDTPIVQIATLDTSATGQRQLCNVNGDQFYHAHDGWRSYRQARAEISGWNQVPLSTQVEQYINAEVPELLEYVSAVFWDNRLLVTTKPTYSNNRAYCDGVLSLDFHPVSTGFAQSAGPAWDGFWSLPGPVSELLVGVFNGRKRCLAMCLINGANTLYEFSKEAKTDDGTSISWEFDTRKFYFDGPGTNKLKTLMEGGSLRTSKRVGQTSISLQYRQDEASNWKDWTVQGQPETGLQGVCTTSGTCILPCPKEYYTPNRLLGSPQDSKDEVTNRDDVDFYDLQAKVKIVGSLQFESIRLQADLPNDKDEKPLL